MKKNIYLLFTILTLGIALPSQGQILNLNYQMGIPLGDSKDFINKMSFRGASLDYHHFVTDRFAVGVNVGWNTFYKNPKYVTDNFTLHGKPVTITGDQFRYLNTITLMASGRYFFTDEDAVVCPYAGLGIGTNWGETRLEVGHYVAKEKGWQFAFSPEIGCLIPFCEHVGLNIGANYFYSAKASGLPALQHFGIKIGLSFML